MSGLVYHNVGVKSYNYCE